MKTGEDTINLILAGNKIKFEREYRFHPDRKWRFDFAIPDYKIAVECEGGIWANGRHVRGTGYRNDCQKYNAAACMGWHILRYTSDMIQKSPGSIVDDVKAIIKLKTGRKTA